MVWLVLIVTRFKTIVEDWKPTLPKDVKYVQMPGFFGPNEWRTHAKLYYALESMGLNQKTHSAIFDEIQNRRNRLNNGSDMAEFLNKRFGTSKKKFADAYNSIGVAHKLGNASGKIAGYQLTGVPAVVVDGRYVVSPGMAGSLEEMPVIVDFLIEKARTQRSNNKGS